MKREGYAPGTFSWVELTTPDAAAASSFYTGLFGWEIDASDAVCRLGGDVVCGLREAAGAAPAWTSRVTVADADDACSRAEALGAAVADGPSDVGDAGRTATLRDPQGAVFAVWQPAARFGAERVNDVGCLCMNELVTADTDTAQSFYEQLFGWTTELADGLPEGAPAGFLLNAGAINGSFFRAPAGTPSFWRVCFTVESTESAVERVRDLGGEPLGATVDIGDGSLVVVRDPQGVVLSLYAGEVDP